MTLPAFDNLTLTHAAAYIGGAVAMGFGAIGAATGEGYTASKASEAIARNQDHAGDIIKNMLVGQAISESASIFSLVIAILLLFMDIPDPGIVKASSLLAAGLCMGFGAIGSGVGAGVPAGLAAKSCWLKVPSVPGPGAVPGGVAAAGAGCAGPGSVDAPPCSSCCRRKS